MTDRDLEYFKNLLETKRTSIVKDLGTLQSHSMQITSAESSGDLTYSDHMPDLGNSTMERERPFYLQHATVLIWTKLKPL